MYHITAEVRDEQHSCMLPRQWGCNYSPRILFAALQDHSMWKMRGLAYMSPCRVCMAYICKWKVHCSLLPEK